MSRMICGLDLGQAQDYTALAICEPPVWCPPAGGWASFVRLNAQQRDGVRLGQWRATRPARAPIWCRHLQRWPIGTSYVQIVDDMAALMRRLEGWAPVLVVDHTGVGRPVSDMLLHRVRGGVLPVTITGGATPGDGTVPKAHLISAVQVLLQSGLLRVSADMPEVPALLEELRNYQVKVTQAANEVFEARSGQHDDLVLALALCAWHYCETTRV